MMCPFLHTATARQGESMRTVCESPQGCLCDSTEDLDVAGHDVVDTGPGMKERAPGLHDGWCLDSHLAAGGPFHAPP